MMTKKYQRKLQEAVFTFIIVPVLFISGAVLVSLLLGLVKEPGFGFLITGGIITALWVYFKRCLKDIKW